MLVGMINIMKEYLILGLAVAVILCLLCFTGYYLVYKKLMHGSKTIDKNRILAISVFLAYIFLVLGATLFGRYKLQWGINLELFSSYKKAMLRFSIFTWQDIILNIIMFVPLGFMLPLLNKIFYKPYFTLLIGFFFTVSIEITQLMTRIGSFDLDDIFNNFLGTVIGYCAIMTITSAVFEKKNKKRNVIIYMLPLLAIALVFIIFLLKM